jgi:hypothetical protein
MKKHSTKRFLCYQFIILGGFFVLTLLNEVIDMPHYILGDPATSSLHRIGEMSVEIVFALLVFGLEILFIQKLRREIRILEGLLPICANCKKVRDLDQWQSIEKYISTHSLANFTHSICPDCFGQLYPEYSSKYQKQLAAEKSKGQAAEYEGRPITGKAKGSI